MVTTRRGTYPRGTYRFRPRRLVKRRKVSRRLPVVRRHRAVGTRKRTRSSGAMLPTKRQRIYKDPNQYRQLETLASKRGRKTSVLRFQRSLVSAAYNYSKYWMRAFDVDEPAGGSDTGGRYNPIGLENPAGTKIYYPVYVYNVTSLPQTINGSFSQMPSGWRLVGDSANPAAVTWSPAFSLDNVGNTQSGVYWNPFVSDVSATKGQTFSKCLMEYLTLRYTLRAPRNRPTKFVVQLVQPYAWFQPNMPDGQITDGTAGVATSVGDNRPWVELANRNSVNMCHNVPSAHRRTWRVLYNRVYDIQPTSSTESDVGGHDVFQKHFWKCNRVLNYGSTHGNYVDNGIWNNLNVTNDQEQARKNWFLPAPGQNVYLIVRAYAPNASSGFDAAVHPSFDLAMEKKIASLGVNGVNY